MLREGIKIDCQVINLKLLNYLKLQLYINHACWKQATHPCLFIPLLWNNSIFEWWWKNCRMFVNQVPRMCAGDPHHTALQSGGLVRECFSKCQWQVGDGVTDWRLESQECERTAKTLSTWMAYHLVWSACCACCVFPTNFHPSVHTPSMFSWCTWDSLVFAGAGLRGIRRPWHVRCVSRTRRTNLAYKAAHWKHPSALDETPIACTPT